MSDITITVDDRAVNAQIDAIAARSGRAVLNAVRESGEELRDAWKANAEVSAGRHGKHYPASIEANILPGFSAHSRIGPNESMRQGGMSFEFGSRNQPPHLDGQRALDGLSTDIRRRITKAALGLL